MSYGYKKGYNPQKYAENRKAEKERTYQMIDDTAIEVSRSPDKLKEFLAVQAKFDMYSAANTLLIFKQMPNATQLKSFEDWNKDGVQVRQKQKSIAILEPVEYTKSDGTPGLGYNVKRVFDVSQTSGKKQPAISLNKDPRDLITTMLDSSPVATESTNELPYPGTAAYYNNDKQTLYVKRDVGDSVKICQNIARELAHAELSINSDEYSRNDSSFAATCIGYMLCKKYGVDTQSFAINRIPDSLKNAEAKDIRQELTKIRNSMSEIHSRINDELYKQKQSRNKDYER